MKRTVKNIEELYRAQKEIASKAVIADNLNPEELKVIAGADGFAPKPRVFHDFRCRRRTLGAKSPQAALHFYSRLHF